MWIVSVGKRWQTLELKISLLIHTFVIHDGQYDDVDAIAASDEVLKKFKPMGTSLVDQYIYV